MRERWEQASAGLTLLLRNLVQVEAGRLVLPEEFSSGCKNVNLSVQRRPGSWCFHWNCGASLGPQAWGGLGVEVLSAAWRRSVPLAEPACRAGTSC